MMTKESETEFYGQISENGILPVISSWALIEQLQVDHERSAFHLIKAGNGTFQK